MGELTRRQDLPACVRRRRFSQGVTSRRGRRRAGSNGPLFCADERIRYMVSRWDCFVAARGRSDADENEAWVSPSCRQGRHCARPRAGPASPRWPGPWASPRTMVRNLQSGPTV